VAFYNSLTLKQRLIFLVILGIVLAISATLFLVYHTLIPFIEQRFVKKVDFLAEHFASASVIGLVFQDPKYLKDLSESILKENEVVGVLILNVQRKPFLKFGHPKKNLPYIEKAIIPFSNEENLVFSQRSSRILGWVRLYYTLKPLRLLMKYLLIKSLLIALFISSLLAFLVYILFSRGLVTPLERLAQATQKIQEGELSFEEKILGAPEVTALAKSFAQMVESLKISQEKLRETYQKMAESKTMAEIGEFSLMIAHEIKNPLGIIKGALDILKKPEIDTVTRTQMVQFIEEEVSRLNQLVQSFLAYARPKKIQKEEVKIRPLLEDIIYKLGLELADLKIQISVVPPDLKAHLDPRWIPQVLLNLVKNAREAGASEVLVEVHPQGSSWVELTIKDDGQGIPLEEREKIFKPFFTTKTQGAGLGLALVEQIVRLHGGRIKVEEASPKGTIFRLYFPQN